MTNLSTALADVLEADRKLCECEINLKFVRAKGVIPLVRGGRTYEDEMATQARDTAKATLEAMSEELIAAMDEHVRVTIRRAVASMPDATTTTEQAIV